MSISYEDFHVSTVLCSQQDTVKFWYQFVFVALYTSL